MEKVDRDKLTKPLQSQVAGRHSSKSNDVVFDIGDGYILKPAQSKERGTREISFYKTLFDKDTSTREEDLLELQPFLPRFYGCVQIDDVTYMKLENLSWNMKEACVMDVKIGAITWDPGASQEKIDREKNKFPPSQELGLRIAGFMTFNDETQSPQHYKKSYCFGLTKETILNEGFGQFLHPVSEKQDIIQTFLTKLKQIELWFLHQKRFKFISSSILFVYDNSREYSEKQRKCDLRMIDFTHVFPTDSTDTNYLHGLQTLIHYFSELLQKPG